MNDPKLKRPAKVERNSAGEGSIRKRPDGRFECRISVIGRDGKHKRVSVYGLTRKEVVAKRDALKSDILTGTFSEPSRVTVAEYLDRWLEHTERDLKPTTHQSYTYLVEKHLKEKLGKVKLTALTALHVEHLQTAMLKEGLSPRTVAYARAVLRRALGQAQRWNLVSRNAAELVEPPKRTAKKVQAWTADEARAFLTAAVDHPLYALFYLALTTGMRRGELLGLRWRDLDVQAATLAIEQNVVTVGNKYVFVTPKTDAGQRTLHLPGEALRILDAHRAAQAHVRAAAKDRWQDLDLIFTSQVGTPVADSTLKIAWNELRAKAGVPRIRFHDLRHTYASLALLRKVEPKTVSERLGHTNVAFTLHTYGHVYDEQRRAAALSSADLFGPEKKPEAPPIERAE